MKYTVLILGLTAAALAQQHSTVPVVLVDDYDFNGSCRKIRNPSASFGNLYDILYQETGRYPYYFDYCQYRSGADVVHAFGLFLNTIPSRPFDVIAYGAGGLIVRSYLAGVEINGGTYFSPVNPLVIRKLVLIGTPNSGSLTGPWGSTASSEISDLYGKLGLGGTCQDCISPYNWNQLGDDLRGVDTIAIAGNNIGSTQVPDSDGLVPVSSAAISFMPSADNQRTRILNGYCHDNAALHTVALCPSPYNIGAIANITGPAHPSYIIIRSFLDGNDAWKKVGASESDPPTSNPPPSNSSTGLPVIFRYGIRPAAGTTPGALSVAADSLITIYGQNLSSATAATPYPWPTQLEDTVVTMHGVPCALSYVSPSQINLLVPPATDILGYGAGSGLVNVVVKTSKGQSSGPFNSDSSFNLMIDLAVPALFALNGNSAAALHVNYQVISASYPAAPGETISLFATGLYGVDLYATRTTPSVFIDGLPATVTFAGRGPGYRGVNQINVQVPTGVHRKTSVPVVVTVTNSPPPSCIQPGAACAIRGDDPALIIPRTSNTVLLAIN
jgi:uncharacterized protein (TIGR03437 family)